MTERAECHDCGTLEGQKHAPGCDMERCPFCEGQLISCGCWSEKLGVDCSEGTWAYLNGMTEEQSKRWEITLQTKGTIPYIVYPNLCRKCGVLWPDLIMYSDAEWEKYIQPDMRKEVVCDDCFKQIKEWVDEAQKGLVS